MNQIEQAETVVITKERYKLLMKASRELIALHAGGVENWEWYGDCIEQMEEQEKGG